MFSTNGSWDVDFMTMIYRLVITHYPRRHKSEAYSPSSRCAEFVNSGADLIPSYCNVALLHAQESSTARARYCFYMFSENSSTLSLSHISWCFVINISFIYFFMISQQMFLAYFLKTFNRYIPYLVCHYVLKESPYFSGFLNNINFTYFQTINPNIFLAYFKNISFWQTDEGLGLGWVDWVGRVKYKDNMKCWKSKYEIIITEGAIWREKTRFWWR